MPKPLPYAAPRGSRACLLGAGLLALAAAPAFAQGTPEQQQACTPDAVKLCSASIPDIPKTTACMKAHYAELTPKCQAAFSDVVGGKTKTAGAADHTKPRAEERRTRHAAIEPAAPAPVAAAPEVAPPVPVHHSALPGLDGYRANIAQLCHQGLIDPFTCRNTMSALELAE